jgi:trigger factor
MHKLKSAFVILLVITIILAALAACSGNGKKTNWENFNYSDGIKENGFWKGVKALKFVELCDYTGIAIPNSIHSISKKSVHDKIFEYLSSFATDEEVTDRAIIDGDTVNIDYVGTVDGEEFEGGSTNGNGADVTIGVTSYIDDFLEQLIGHTPGETFDIEVTFPEDYGVENLNGKDAVFATTVNYILEKKYPELTDEFVRENFLEERGWNTAAEMETEVKSEMQKKAVFEYLEEYIVANSTVSTVPESMVDYQQNAMLKYYKNLADNYGIDFEDLMISYFGFKNIDEFLAENLDKSVETAKYYLIIQAIAEDLKLDVSEQDISEYFMNYFNTDDYSGYQDQFGMPYLKLVALGQKVLDYLSENAVLE